MAQTALIIGGSGQIGQAVAARLLAEGWNVRVGQRHPADVPAGLISAGAQVIPLDRSQPDALGLAVAGGVDAVIDTVAYDGDHAAQLLRIQSNVGSLVVISSASVYADDKGRSLDEATSVGFPCFPDLIGEGQVTVPPGPLSYSTRKVALEQALLQAADVPVCILRPCAIYGPGSRGPREWWFVKRIRDGRPVIPLAFDGASRFHTSATVNIAALVEMVLRAPKTQILNIGDPMPLTAAQIGAAIATVYDYQGEIRTFPGPPRNGVGSHPWCLPRPIVVDMRAATALGYRPVATYRQAVGAACRSVEASRAKGLSFAPYLEAMFDYAAEDALALTPDR